MEFRLPCIQIAIALLLLTQAKSTTEESSTHPDGPITSCIAGERSAVLAFRAGLSDPEDPSDSANLLSSWKDDDCCRWKGVYCSNRTGHVVRLELRGTNCGFGDGNMQGQVLSDNISTSLLALEHLRYVDLFQQDTNAGVHWFFP
ncbi:hypothetical protein ACQ4PT_059680 [Festuca glaucescens]